MDRTSRFICRAGLTWSLFWVGWCFVITAVRITQARWGWAMFDAGCGAFHLWWVRRWLADLAVDRRVRADRS